MSEQNKTILQLANAAITKGDHEGFLSHCTEDVQWIFVGDQTLQGKAAVRQYMKTTYIEPPQFRVDQLIADNEFVIAIGDIAIKDAAGKVTTSAYCDVWRIRDGKLAELKAYVVEMK